MKILLLVLSLLGLIGYRWIQSREKTHGVDEVPLAMMGGETSRGGKSPILTDKVMEIRAERQQKIEEADKVMARNGRRMDSETKVLLINRLMETRRPIYEELFEGWNLDGATQENLLNVIREREEMLFDAHRDHNLAGRKGLDDFKASYEVEKALAEAQFVQLVGVERGKKILELEQSLQTGSVEKAKVLTDKRLMD